MPGIKRGKDYHFHSRKLLESSRMKADFPEEIFTTKLGNVEFDVMTVQMDMPGITVSQEHYATAMKDYALIFIITYTNDEDKTILDDALNSISFN